jgi:hypothetical protein
MPQSAELAHATTINRAAMMLLAMSVRPECKASLIEEVIAAVEQRGGRLDDHSFIKFDLRAVFEEIAERAMAILSAALRQRLPGIADEMDEAFGLKLRTLLASLAPLFPTA